MSKITKIFEINLQSNLKERGVDVKVEFDIDGNTCKISKTTHPHKLIFQIDDHSLQSLADEIVNKLS